MCKGRTKTVIGKVELPNLFRARSATACSPRFICMLDYPERSLSEVKPTLTRWHCEATPRERVFSRSSVILGKFKAGRLHPKSRSMCSRCASWTSLKSKATWRSCSGRKTAIGWYIMHLISFCRWNKSSSIRRLTAFRTQTISASMMLSTAASLVQILINLNPALPSKVLHINSVLS